MAVVAVAEVATAAAGTKVPQYLLLEDCPFFILKAPAGAFLFE